MPAVTTAIGVPFHVPVRPVSATGVLGVRREASAAATVAGAATRPPAYSGRTAAVRSAGRPRPLTPLGAGLGVVALGEEVVLAEVVLGDGAAVLPPPEQAASTRVRQTAEAAPTRPAPPPGPRWVVVVRVVGRGSLRQATRPP